MYRNSWLIKLILKLRSLKVGMARVATFAIESLLLLLLFDDDDDDVFRLDWIRAELLDDDEVVGEWGESDEDAEAVAGV